ncbi:hypothetical protein SADUNF_Sadunf04G0018900 [Salix dunnii]|uniref:RNase H type-1 domain-containing protein n=1 Tax=Salix dunnii TaxID=1413687 RepID=A0A835KED2_9ROSI|nr:hypothetical protein SADUNF_Sadunf04G0018900 [Salix dunnii]
MLSFTNISRCQTRILERPARGFIRNLHRGDIPVSWKRPQIGWTKLNFDGSCKGAAGEASIGGLFRNHKAEFLLGYAESIGTTTSTVAELAALRRGLELVLENGWSNVWLEGDSKSSVDIILKRQRVRSKEAQRQVSRINLIMPELENCVLTHVFREGNRAADKLASIGHQMQKPKIWRHIPPDDILWILQEDAKGSDLIVTLTYDH